MCENIRVDSAGDSYMSAVLDAMVKVKDVLEETEHVFRDPEECHDGDWFLAHTQCELSMGGTQVGGVFVFQRYGDEQ